MTTLETLVGVTTTLYRWFGLMDDSGLDAREMFADATLPLLSSLDREGAFMAVREEFLDRADTLLDRGGRFFDSNVEHRVRGIVEAVRTTTDPEALLSKLTEWL